MPANFNIQFIVNEKTQTRVLKLTDASSGFTLTKGNFSITFPDGSTRIKTDFVSPDISAPEASINIPAVLDTANNVITGTYKIDFVAINASNTEYTSSITFDFNWVKPANGITNEADVLIPEVKFKDNTSYSPIGSFTGTLNRTLSASFPSTSEATGGSVSTVSENTINLVSSGKYYDGTYNPTSDVSVIYTYSGDSRITIQYVELFTKTFLIKRCPTQVELVVKINNYRALIDAYKGNNDTQFNLLSEQYDLVIALYSHLITRYETSTQDGSEPVLRELLSILEPYATSYTPQLTRMLPFEIASTGTNSFNVSDGTNTDSIPLGSTLLLSSGNPAFTINVSNNIVTYTPTFGSTSNTFAQGNDTRFHNAVTIGTANGLSLASQVLSLALATTSTSGAFSASDKAKLDGIAAGANTGTVTSVAISVPSAFSVSGSPITTNGTINISATGNPLQYITGAGALATLNTGAVPELTNLYFTNTRARASISVSGSLAYNSSTGVISYTTPSETDPIFVASAAYGISSTNISNWNTAYGWGNHASAGYLTSINSSQVTTALGYTPENAANKGVANGYASLDGAGLVPSTQLPSYVDDVLEYADLASLPATGTTGKIYVTLDTNKIYRWSGTIYVEISSSAGGGGTWGSITGTLSNQTDLQAALDAKQNSLGFTPVTNARTLTINGVTYDLTANRTWTIGGTLAAGGTAGQILSKVDSTDYNTAWIDQAPAASYTSQLKHDVKLGATLVKGKAVYVSSANGTNMVVSAASNASEATSSKTLGLLETGGVTNDTVKVVTEGLLSGLNTSTATAGDPVWLGTNGDLIFGLTNKPVAPAHLVFIGIVTRVQSSNGEIFVKVQNGFELQELHNVLISSVANNEGLFYESSTGLWKNKTIAAVLGYTPYNAANPSNYISLTALSSTATGLTYTNTTGVFSLTSGYVIPTTTEESNWNTAYGWGNHASAGYLTTSAAASTYQPLDEDLTAIAAIAGTSGLLKKTAANTWSLDTNTYLTSYTETDPIYTASSWYSTTNNSSNWDTAYGWGNHASAGYLTTSAAASTYQPVDADLTAIAGLAGTSGFLKKTAANTWSLDTNTYLTSYTETDPIYTASSWYTTTNNASNWNTAYGWGNHASAGYLTSITSSNVTTALGYTPVTNARTLTINGTTYDLTANRSWTISGSDSTKLPLAGGTMTGQIVSTTIEALKMTTDNCYISGWNTAGTTRYGYLQFGTGSLNLFSEAGAALNIGANSTSRIYITAAGNTGMGTTSPLSMLHLYGGTLTVNSSGTSDVAGGMRVISHSVKKVGGSKFIKIYAGTNNYFTGFIFGYNFDDYPPNSATNTGAGFAYQFGGWSDGNGACGDKYFDLQWFGGNNVGNMGREMNTDGYGYILTSPTSTGAGGYKCSATIMLFARDMSKISITYY